MIFSNLIEQLKKQEGFRESPYKDTEDNWTIGYGHLIKKGEQYLDITKEEAEQLLKFDVVVAYYETLKIFSDLEQFPQEIKEVLVNMCYNLGRPRLLTFKKFIRYIQLRDYSKAADEMLDSKWAKQVKTRAIDLANIVRNTR